MILVIKDIYIHNKSKQITLMMPKIKISQFNRFYLSDIQISSAVSEKYFIDSD